MTRTRDHLESIFEAERTLRRAERALLSAPPAELSPLLAAAVEEALALPDAKESALRLERLADLCAQVPGPAMADALISILGADPPSARIEAYEALLDVAYERYAEVARAIERALSQGHGGHAMRELPFLLAEVAEPSARPLISRFLALNDAELVASAVEALATLGDPAAIADLEPLIDDPRTVSLDREDEDEEPGIGDEERATLGDLVAEAIAALRDGDDEDDD